MGCVSSKHVKAGTLDVYRPAATSFAVFDINSITEPWLPAKEQQDDEKQKTPSHLPVPIEKLDDDDDDDVVPRPWEEVRKDLEELKPTLNSPTPRQPTAATPPDTSPPEKKMKRKSFSFHTLEELENNTKAGKNNNNNKPGPGLKKTESCNELSNIRLKRTDPGTKPGSIPPPVIEGYKSLKDNPFLLRDKEEREKQGLPPLFMKRDPLEDFPEICPPGGSDKVVIYLTSLGGIRRTYEDCNRVRSIMELHGFLYEERDISLHGEFRTQLKELLGDSASVPRMFVKGRYIGGVDEIVGLNETGRLRRILSRVGIEKEVGRQACEGCGGARFVPCLECGGSCKIAVDGKKEKERCPECNENGLMYCPMCS
ncbi:putative glutaredoxin, Thioredoxin-like superfamily [Helianthus annuus]|nr:putative glutaredoxin, Thioredoxin-like superfamily [Helianthus annuus]